MAPRPTTQMAVLEYCHRKHYLISSAEVARYLDVSQSHAQKLLRTLAAQGELKQFNILGGQVYLSIKRLGHKDGAAVQSQLVYIGLRCDEMLKNPKTVTPDALINLENMLAKVYNLLKEINAKNSKLQSDLSDDEGFSGASS